MHDLRMIRDQIELLREGMRRRGKLDSLAQAIDRAEALESERRTKIQAVEERKSARNTATREVALLKRAGKDATSQQNQSREMGDDISGLESELALAEGALNQILLEIPNVTLPDVPPGGEESNSVIREWGAPRSPATRPHWEIGEALGIIDFQRGSKIAGSGFIVFRSAGARLVRSLINLMLDVHTRDHGYDETWVPILVNRAAMTGTAQLPKFEDDMYALRDEDMFLIPTAEVPITNLYRDEIIPAAELPKAFTAYSPCFRREAGSHGKDTRGLLRVHEFDKVELVRYCLPEESGQQLELLTLHAEKIVQMLELPYRVTLLAAGDTGFASARTHDIEVFSPGVAKWLEVSSCSTFADFQARRAGIRYRPADGGKPQFVHTLNGSGLALPRIIAALLEHNYNADGSVTIPPALRPYMGVDRLS